MRTNVTTEQKKQGRMMAYILLASVVTYIVLPPFLSSVVWLPLRNTKGFSEFLKAFNNLSESTPDKIKLACCLFQFICGLPFIVIFLVSLRKEISLDFKTYNENKGRNLAIILLTPIAMNILSVAVSLIYDLLGITGVSQNEGTIHLLMASSGRWYIFASVVLVAPLIEEIFFRKLMFGICEKRFGMNPFLTIAISSLIFSFIHVDSKENLKYIFQYLVLAVPICFAYHLSGNNFFVPFIIHFINNFSGAILWIIQSTMN